MHMRAKNNMGILDMFPSEFSRMRGVCWAKLRADSAISIFVTQEKDATVIVVTGPDNGRVGTLYGIDGADGIVQLDDDIKILDLGHLAECEEG